VGRVRELREREVGRDAVKSAWWAGRKYQVLRDCGVELGRWVRRVENALL
jgi:hypothetical protein